MQLNSFYVLHRLEKICRSVFQYNVILSRQNKCQLWQNGDINNMHGIFLIACCFFLFYYFIKDYVLVHMSGFVACVS